MTERALGDDGGKMPPPIRARILDAYFENQVGRGHGMEFGEFALARSVEEENDCEAQSRSA
jgi:hypothetical protein